MGKFLISFFLKREVNDKTKNKHIGVRVQAKGQDWLDKIRFYW